MRGHWEFITNRAPAHGPLTVRARHAAMEDEATRGLKGSSRHTELAHGTQTQDTSRQRHNKADNCRHCATSDCDKQRSQSRRSEPQCRVPASRKCSPLLPAQHITNAFVISHNVNLYSVQSKQIVQKKKKSSTRPDGGGRCGRLKRGEKSARVAGRGRVERLGGVELA